MDRRHVVLPFNTETGQPQATDTPASKEAFLFVNETTSAPVFKLGGRQDIRSHVRRNIAKKLRQSLKGEKLAVEKQSKSLRVPRLAPQERPIALSNHYGTRFCECQRTSLGISPTGIEDTIWNPTKTQLRDQEASQTSNFAAAMRIPTEKDHYDRRASSSAFENMKLLESEVSSESSISQDNPPVFCPTCGSRLYRAKAGGGGKGMELALRKPARRGAAFNPSPVTILGAGRVDPFLSYPVEKPTPKLHELMDHAVNCLLPGLLLDGDNPQVSSLSKVWFATGLQHRLLFHALAFAGSIHLNFLRTSRIFPNSPQALTHKLAAIEELRTIMKDPQQSCRDEVILAVLTLSSHEIMAPLQPNKNPFNSPLRKAQWLNIYGSIIYVPEHMKAVMELTTIRGGVEKLELYGLTEILAIGDVTAAAQALSKPALPPIAVSKTWIATIQEWATSPPRLAVPTLGRCFHDLHLHGLSKEIIGILDGIVALTMAMNHYIDGQPAGLSLEALSKGRFAIEHSLLSLPAVEKFVGLPIAQSLVPDIYETCRLTALIYGVAVVYPIPNSYHVLHTLVRSLKDAIEACKFAQLATLLPNYLLWILVLGGIAAFGKPERIWYVTQLARLVMQRGIYEWEEVEQELSSFLWMKSAFVAGAIRLWSETTETIYALKSIDRHH